MKQIDLPEDRDGFRFRGGHIALDLAATLAGRQKDEPRDLLVTRHDLGRWLICAGLASERPQATEQDLALARTLREAIYAVASGRATRRSREQLNDIAAMRPASPRLTPSGRLILKGSATELLATIAAKAIELFGGADAERIRECEGDGCALLFLDQSRSGRRRWCSMQGCGNRAKAHSFRHRNR